MFGREAVEELASTGSACCGPTCCKRGFASTTRVSLPASASYTRAAPSNRARQNSNCGSAARHSSNCPRQVSQLRLAREAAAISACNRAAAIRPWVGLAG